MPGTEHAYNFEPDEQPDAYLQSIRTYREAIQNLSQMLIQTSWLDLSSKSTVFITVEKGLRDTISTLELLGEDPVNDRVDITAVLNALNDALFELDGAAIYADNSKDESRIKGLKKVRVCRDYLNLAINLMNY